MGADADAGQTVFETDMTGALGVVMGAEDKGLRRLTREHCDRVVRLPILEQVESLNLSMELAPSAMSHVLHRLRQQLDDPVLVKTSHGMQPTERALSLIGPVGKVLREIEELTRPPSRFDPATSQRRFVLAATDYLEFLMLPPLIERLVQLAPGAAIHVQRTGSEFPTESLENNTLDMVLGFEVMLSPPALFPRLQLFDDRMWPCLVRKDHPLAMCEAFSLDEYLEANHMLISRTGSNTGVIDDWLAERRLERRVGLIVPHFLSAALIVAQTDMVLSLPLRIGQRFMALAPLKVLPMPFALPAFNLVMIWHPLREKDPGHLWLREQIRDVCQAFRATPDP